jgi:cytidylate kinase
MNLNPVIIISGYAASGKTTLARKLARNLQYEFVDLGSIIRLTTLGYLSENPSGNEEILRDETAIQAYVEDLELLPRQQDNRSIQISINGTVLDIDDDQLRNPLLDTGTLIMSKLIRPKLTLLQREIARLTPVIFSARNAAAFSREESIRIHIDPGMTTRIRRRARYEGGDYGELSRQERRDLIERVVGKEWESMQLGIALSGESAEKNGFVIFSNSGVVETSLAQLTALSLDLIKAKGWLINLGIEGNQNYGGSPERM